MGLLCILLQVYVTRVTFDSLLHKVEVLVLVKVLAAKHANSRLYLSKNRTENISLGSAVWLDYPKKKKRQIFPRKNNLYKSVFSVRMIEKEIFF